MAWEGECWIAGSRPQWHGRVKTVYLVLDHGVALEGEYWISGSRPQGMAWEGEF